MPLKTSGFAIASLVCGIVGLMSCCAFLPSILGIVFGAIAIGSIGRGEARGRGLAMSGIVLGVLGILAGVGVWIILARTPAVAPIRGVEVSADDRRTLESMKVLQPNEPIELFYASGLFSVDEGGVVITAERLVVYAGASDIEECRLDEIRAVQYDPAGSWFGDGNFIVEPDDGEIIWFTIPGQEGGDKVFHEVLTRQASEAREAAGKPPVASQLSDAVDSRQDEDR